MWEGRRVHLSGLWERLCCCAGLEGGKESERERGRAARKRRARVFGRRFFFVGGGRRTYVRV